VHTDPRVFAILKYLGENYSGQDVKLRLKTEAAPDQPLGWYVWEKGKHVKYTLAMLRDIFPKIEDRTNFDKSMAVQAVTEEQLNAVK
jgi:hypothetical protein